MPNQIVPNDFNNVKVDSSSQARVTELNAIKQEIFNLLSTPKGTREGNLSLGVSVYDHLIAEFLDENGLGILAELAGEIESQIQGVTVNFGQSNIVANLDHKSYRVFLSCQVSFLENQDLLVIGDISA